MCFVYQLEENQPYLILSRKTLSNPYFSNYLDSDLMAICRYRVTVVFQFPNLLMHFHPIEGPAFGDRHIDWLCSPLWKTSIRKASIPVLGGSWFEDCYSRIWEPLNADG